MILAKMVGGILHVLESSGSQQRNPHGFVATASDSVILFKKRICFIIIIC